MTRAPKRMSFDEFARHLRMVFEAMAQEREPILVEREGLLYRLEPQEDRPDQDIWADYDPDQVRQALQHSAGALADIDREALLRELHEQRQQGSWGRPA